MPVSAVAATVCTKVLPVPQLETGSRMSSHLDNDDVFHNRTQVSAVAATVYTNMIPQIETESQ